VTKVTSEQARAYLARWELARGAEAAEVRLTSMETKLVQLAALMASRDAFAREPDRDAQIREVRERWARLHQALNG
jgi:hypothetical protein